MFILNILNKYWDKFEKEENNIKIPLKLMSLNYKLSIALMCLQYNFPKLRMG